MSARLAPASASNMQECSGTLTAIAAHAGYLPNDYLAMAHQPSLLDAVVQLTDVVLNRLGTLPGDLQGLLPYLVSRKAGCDYCAVHAADHAGLHGTLTEKLCGIDHYRSDSRYTEAECAVLDVLDAIPATAGIVDDATFHRLHEHFSAEQIVHIVALISLTRFYNTWNTIMATELELPCRRNNAEVKIAADAVNAVSLHA